jgi:uncharacterized protein YrrD
MMRIKEGTNVYSARGDSVGKVDRVVIDPRTKEVTHLVIRKGFLLVEDKVLSISLVASADEDRVQLRQDAGDLRNLPPFEETNYVPLDQYEALQTGYQEGNATPLYWYPSASFETLGRSGMWPIPVTGTGPQYAAETHQNIPTDSVALEAGANVIAADGEHVGDLEAVFTDPSSDRATHLVIQEGFLLKEKKLVPTEWVTRVEENQIHLSVGSQTVERLRKYEQ